MKGHPFFKTLWNLLLMILIVWLFIKSPFYVTVSLLVVVACVYGMKKSRRKKTEVKPQFADFIAQYGNPDVQIIINPTRGNDIDGAVLYYRCLDMMVMNGQIVQRTDITAMELKNMENPYLPCDYEIRVETNRDDCPCLFLAVGGDMHWAADVMKQLQEIV